MPKIKLNVIGERLKQIRLSKVPSITQEQLSVKLQLLDWDIGRFGISKIERGERQITDKELLVLSKALEVDVSVFFDRN